MGYVCRYFSVHYAVSGKCAGGIFLYVNNAGCCILYNNGGNYWGKGFIVLNLFQFVLYVPWCKADFISLVWRQSVFEYLYNGNNDINAHILV